LYGKDGAFAPLLKDFLETALEAELEAHLDQERRKNGNRRNGQSSEILKTADGSFELSTSRDRNSDFEPQIVRKRETI
jgi:transposase-like protein